MHRNIHNTRRVLLGLAIACLLPAVQAQTAASSHDMDMKAQMKANGEAMMSMPMTGNQDIDFAMMMRMHHMGALQMAEQQLEHGKDPQMRTMAGKIISSQKKEIAQFERFLARRGHPVSKGK